MSSRPPAGWYKNPNNPLQEQYWDGQRWSGVFRATPPERPAASLRLNSIEHLDLPGIGRAEYGLKLAILSLWSMIGLGLTAPFLPRAGGISEAGVVRVILGLIVVFFVSWLTYTLMLRTISKKRVANAGLSPGINRLILVPYLQTLVAIVLMFLPPRASRDAAEETVKLRIRAHSEGEARMLASDDLGRAATAGYRQEGELWIPGRWSGGDFLLAALAALIVVGILVILAMLMIKPKGALILTLRPGSAPIDLVRGSAQAAPSEMKTCPRCAEDVKAAALVCRFCGHSFTPA